jgi:hypothetical protein
VRTWNLHFESSILRYYLAGNLATTCLNAGHLKPEAGKILFLSNKIALLSVRPTYYV